MRAFGLGLQRVGQGLMVLGAIGVFVSAVVGTLIADAFILYAILSNKDSHRSDSSHSFLTGIMWGYIFASMANSHNHHHHARVSRSISPALGIPIIVIIGAVMSAIGIVLALHYALPFVALLIGFLWLGSCAMFLMGLGMDVAGREIVESVNRDVQNAVTPGYDRPFDQTQTADLGGEQVVLGVVPSTV